MMYKFQFNEFEVYFLYCRWARVWGRLVPLEILLLQQVATLQYTLHHTLNCTLYSRCTVHCTADVLYTVQQGVTLHCTSCVLYAVHHVYCTLYNLCTVHRKLKFNRKTLPCNAPGAFGDSTAATG